MNETTANTPHLQGGKGLLPYPVIVAAVSGSVDAMNTVLKHYEGYIGSPHPWVDEELRRRLETKLIITVMTFNVA